MLQIYKSHYMSLVYFLLAFLVYSSRKPQNNLAYSKSMANLNSKFIFSTYFNFQDGFKPTFERNNKD